MTDKNGVEIATGAIVEITGAYFKGDNALYFVTSSPGDSTWSGSDYSLHKVSKRGKVSTAKNRICFWPISVFVSSRAERAKANEWNEAHAQIEVKAIENMTEVRAYFEEKAEALRELMKRDIQWFGEDSEAVKRDQRMLDHYKAVLARI